MSTQRQSSTKHPAPRTRTKRLASVLVTVTAPRQLRIRVPHGRTPGETILRALTKAQSRIYVRGSLTC